MKKFAGILILTVIVSLVGCNSNKKSEEIAGYATPAKAGQSAPAKPLAAWVKEGITCYGIVVSVDKEGNPIIGMPVKSKVVSIKGGEVKMKALETVNVSEVKGCTKMGLKKNETWIEKEGDLFQTKEDAINFLKEKKISMNS
jgi:hypothetical protein